MARRVVAGPSQWLATLSSSAGTMPDMTQSFSKPDWAFVDAISGHRYPTADNKKSHGTMRIHAETLRQFAVRVTNHGKCELLCVSQPAGELGLSTQENHGDAESWSTGMQLAPPVQLDKALNATVPGKYQQCRGCAPLTRPSALTERVLLI
jgi:hypothetical protein